jgi:hypothetical protein
VAIALIIIYSFPLMSQQLHSSKSFPQDKTAAAAAFLLAKYSFDLGYYKPSELVQQWLNDYPASWIRLAVIEALYLGRYKAISVQQILTIWAKRQQPLYHFNYEFDRLICSKLPEYLTIFGGEQPKRETLEPADLSHAIAQSPSGDIAANSTSVAAPEITGSTLADPRSRNLPPNQKPSKSEPINQFIPAQIDRYFYYKLKAIAYGEEWESGRVGE